MKSIYSKPKPHHVIEIYEIAFLRDSLEKRNASLFKSAIIDLNASWCILWLEQQG